MSVALAACSARPQAVETRERPAPQIDAAVIAVVVDAGAPDALEPDPPDVPRPLSPELRAQLEGLYEEHYAEEILPAIRWLVARPAESRPPVRLIVRAMRVEPATGHALEILGLIGDPRDVPLIAEVLRHPDAPETMRWDAAGALAAHPAGEAEAALMSALDDPQGDVVDAAISALGDRRSEAARTRLEALLDHPVAATRYRVVLALKDLGHQRSAAALRKRAKVETGQYVMKVLADLGY